MGLRLPLAAVCLVLALSPAVAAARSDPNAIAWGERSHTAPNTLESWLAARGADYATWAERHPGAAERLAEPTPPVVPDPPQPLRPPAAALERSSADYAVVILVPVVATGALLVLAGAALSFAAVRVRVGYRVIDRQPMLVLGTGLLVSAAVGFALTLLQ